MASVSSEFLCDVLEWAYTILLMSSSTETDYKIPYPSGKTDATVVGSQITDTSGAWNLLEESAASTAEQRARFLNAQVSNFEFAYTLLLVAGAQKSRLYGRVKHN